MKPIINTVGFFTMDDANEIASMANLAQAKEYARNRVDEFVTDHPKTRDKNISKALNMIEKSNTINKLVLGIGSFVLSHPSENLRLIK